MVVTIYNKIHIENALSKKRKMEKQNYGIYLSKLTPNLYQVTSLTTYNILCNSVTQ